MSDRRPWYRTPWVFAACGVALLLFWFALKWLRSLSDADAAEPVGRSEIFRAGPTDILFWVAVVLIGITVIMRIWRLVRRIRR
ncbi:hypothetical protein [Brevibacterium aurantiacum]|uniref:hypothetical protein n=1 Tax=Brevibacterium aurantiacum TaxID=273384 RepID=UPI000F63E492|nr:hypothetical protein [Brevibacterium aurantiacum]AZL06374.1 hypothetical protein CXR24_12870 [Brevibacterium aurantiacum]AZL09932.1 hypothetical protein CXR26_12390 [Brevibacterium aurantiacum]AZL13585.1 hypothetical protein CXR25_12760 [Brevibacterium aurantiacum]